jgi:hypothetical protein
MKKPTEGRAEIKSKKFKIKGVESFSKKTFDINMKIRRIKK